MLKIKGKFSDVVSERFLYSWWVRERTALQNCCVLFNYVTVPVCVHTGVQGAGWAEIRTITMDTAAPDHKFSQVFIPSRRNILSDINNAEFTMLPVPQEKESLQVFLRVKPKTDHELKVFR